MPRRMEVDGMRLFLCVGVLATWLVSCGLGRAAWAEQGDPWRQFTQAWEKAGSSGRESAVAGLVAELRRQGGVLKSEDAMTFVFVSSAAEVAKPVELDGDFTGWGRRVPLERFGHSPVFSYRLAAVPRDARLEYKYYVGGKERLDTLNPRRVANGMGGENSVTAMPGYRGVMVPGRASLRAGSLVSFDFQSRLAGNRRLVSVYLPPSYRKDPKRTYPTVYIHDGASYLKYARTAAVVDALQQQRRIQEVILVFVDPVDRWKEYARDPVFTRMFVEELVPYVDAHYRTRREAGARCVLGASMGGLIAMHLAFTRPQVFGMVASQSGAFHRPDGALGREVSAAERKPLRVYVDVGLYDLLDEKRNLLDQSRDMKKILEARGYPLRYVEYAGGHNYVCWSDQLPSIFEYFFKKP